MAGIDTVRRDVVFANRVLAHEGVVDAFGHVSARHPDRADRFLLSRSRSPELVTLADILEYTLDSELAEPSEVPQYNERFIHGSIYKARPEVMAVVHTHAYELIPFSVTQTLLRPLLHVAAMMGGDIPIWDIRDRFGDTNLLVVNNEMAADLVACLGGRVAALMRGHGGVVVGPNVPRAVMTAVYMKVNAQLQLAAHQLGEITFLSEGEIALMSQLGNLQTAYNRAWDYFCSRAGCTDQ